MERKIERKIEQVLVLRTTDLTINQLKQNCENLIDMSKLIKSEALDLDNNIDSNLINFEMQKLKADKILSDMRVLLDDITLLNYLNRLERYNSD